MLHKEIKKEFDSGKNYHRLHRMESQSPHPVVVGHGRLQGDLVEQAAQRSRQVCGQDQGAERKGRQLAHRHRPVQDLFHSISAKLMVIQLRSLYSEHSFLAKAGGCRGQEGWTLLDREHYDRNEEGPP